jgi:RNA polymerase sigma-70 factor (ECF subfamily)
MPDQSRANLDRITTRWTVVKDSGQFVLRYAPAIRRYIGAMVHDENETEDILQDFLFRVVQHGFASADADRGRFRYYLKTSVRNAVRSHLRQRKGPKTIQSEAVVADVADSPASAEFVGDEWIENWRECLMDRVWQTLEQHEHSAEGNLFHTVLRLSVEYPKESSSQLAKRTEGQIQAAAFRKQLSRARRMFASTLLNEVAETLDDPSAEEIEEELVETGLMRFVGDFLPDDWRTSRELPDEKATA